MKNRLCLIVNPVLLLHPSNRPIVWSNNMKRRCPDGTPKPAATEKISCQIVFEHTKAEDWENLKMGTLMNLKYLRFNP